ncbi:MAG: leucine-rich repeat domain-containing protein [Cyclobacteriaceae bacterium]|nr:leucine-rich repeat domain-containing protein [Cyclobacteriaceae bacterium HetDA_MAG_MS6]
MRLWLFTTIMTVSGGFGWAQNSAESQLSIEQKQRQLRREMVRAEIEGKDVSSIRAMFDSLRRVDMERSASKRILSYAKNNRVDTLKVIDLTDGRLTKLPDYVLEARSLKVLKLDNNDFGKLPRKLKNLDSLQRIYWSRINRVNKLKFPPMDHLENLYLGQNQLSRLPSMKKLKRLKYLDLSGNHLARVPVKSLRKNKELSQLVLTSNPIIVQEDKYQRLKALEVLKLNKCGLQNLNTSLYRIPKLKELQVQENNLESVPAGISTLEHLTKLSFYKNKLNTLPEDLFDIPSLVIVDLYYNELQVIPSEIKNLQKLEILFLAHNKIYDLPDEIGELRNLEQLYLHHNRLSVLPESLDQLENLRVVRVNDNYLHQLPKSLLMLAQLSDLDVSNNDLKTLPKEIERFSELELFTFQGNEIDLNADENQHVAPMIERMSKKGVVCKPAVRMEVID